MQERKRASTREGKEAPNENMTKYYKLPISNEKMHMYLNTTRYA